MTEINCQDCKHSIIKSCKKGGGKIVQNLYCKLFAAGKDGLMLASTARTKHPSAGDAKRCGKGGRFFEKHNRAEGEGVGMQASKALTLIGCKKGAQALTMASVANKHAKKSHKAFKPYTVKVDGDWGSTARGDRS